MIFTGTVIGAGFASGQEIMQYFLKYGNAGVFGIFLSIAIFTFLVCVIMCKIQYTGASDAAEYLGGCPLFIKRVYCVLTSGFMLVSFCVMVIASGEMFYEHAGMPRWFGIVLMLAVSIYCFYHGNEGIVIINKLMTPLIVIVTIIVFADKMLFCGAKPVFKAAVFNNPATSAFVYVSYNTLSLISVMTAVKKYITTKSEAVLSSLFGGTMLLITALCIWCILRSENVYNSEIPMLAAISPYMKCLYIPVLFFAMATTAVSNGTGVINSINLDKTTVILAMVLIMLIMKRFGFSGLVANVYAFFGYAGFIIGVYTIADGIKYIKLRKTAKKEEKRSI